MSFLSDLTAKISNLTERFNSGGSVSPSQTSGTEQTKGASFWQRYALNFNSPATSQTSLSNTVLHQVSQAVQTTRGDGDLPAPKAIILLLKSGVKQAGHHELARRVV